MINVKQYIIDLLAGSQAVAIQDTPIDPFKRTEIPIISVLNFQVRRTKIGHANLFGTTHTIIIDLAAEELSDLETLVDTVEQIIYRDVGIQTTLQVEMLGDTAVLYRYNDAGDINVYNARMTMDVMYSEDFQGVFVDDLVTISQAATLAGEDVTVLHLDDMQNVDEYVPPDQDPDSYPEPEDPAQDQEPQT